MRFKSQAQAGFGARRQGTLENCRKCHTTDSRADREHDTTRHDTTRAEDTICPIALPLYKYALPSSPLSVLALSRRALLRTHTRGPIQIPLLLLLRPPVR